MATIHLTKDEFLKRVSNIEVNSDGWKFLGDKPAVVDFYAQWCGPCRKLAPVLEQLQNEFGSQVNFVKIDTDKNINCAKEYGVSSLPSLLFFKNGEVQEMMAGLTTKTAIISNIKKYL
jgi:thioredoxin